jgi:hypothetical protein
VLVALTDGEGRVYPPRDHLFVLVEKLAAAFHDQFTTPSGTWIEFDSEGCHIRYIENESARYTDK